MAVNEKLEIDTMRLQGDIDDLRSHLRRMEQQGEEMMGGMGINAIEALRGNRLMLRGLGLNSRELDILGIMHAGE